MPPSKPESERRRAWLLLVAVLVPCLALAWANGVFTYNHFYARAPFLHDAGWFSYTVFRQGLVPHNLPSAEPRPLYFSMHVSLVVTLGSLLSYLFPGGRIAWYCVFQAAIYAPLGAATALLFRTVPTRAALFVAGVTAGGLVFAFNGEALACMGYPHFEIAIAAGFCLMLAGLASGRERLAWAGLLLAIAGREDGGAQAATFLVAVLACGRLGRPFAVPTRRVVWMTVVAASATALLMLVQKFAFNGASLFHHEYLGDPVYAHLSGTLIRARLLALGHGALFLVLPFVATMVIALLDRDARWLIGWMVAGPWFILNLLANQELKAEFNLYGGFPFLGSMFWVGAYARTKYGDVAPRVLVRLAAVSLASLIGMFWSSPGTRYLLLDMLSPVDVDGPALRAFARDLTADPARYGRLRVDPAIASWVATLPAEARTWTGSDLDNDALARFDAFAFFRVGLLAARVQNTVVNGRFTACFELPRTAVVFCGRPGGAVPPGFHPIAFLKDSLFTDHTGRRVGHELLVGASSEPLVATFGPFLTLAPGAYRVTFGVRITPGCNAAPDVGFDVVAKSGLLVAGHLPLGASAATLDFDLPALVEAVDIRSFSGPCAYTLESVELAPRP